VPKVQPWHFSNKLCLGLQSLSAGTMKTLSSLRQGLFLPALIAAFNDEAKALKSERGSRRTYNWALDLAFVYELMCPLHACRQR